ncbi:MAG: rRNA adenine N-6-methyltransferase family protein [Merdibacter sp.]
MPHLRLPKRYWNGIRCSPKKSYGQNFLVDSGVVEKIARHAVISDHCVVFEIGPGIGALTQWLCAYAKQVVSFEIDERTAQRAGRYPAGCRQLYAGHGRLSAGRSGGEGRPELRAQGYDVVIAANLPYYITTPILFKIFESEADIAAITVMMQNEVADRFHAEGPAARTTMR